MDPSAAVVPGAKVTLTDLGHGSVKQAETRETGFVVFDSLQPGEYSLETVKAGFDTYRVDRLTLKVRDRQTFRVELKITAAAGAKVEVTAMAEAVSSDVVQGTSLDQNYVANLPANGRNAESLILMTPGITTAAGGKGDGGYNANGLRSNQNYYILDGVSLNRFTSQGGGAGGPGLGGAPVGAGSTEMITIDAMQEMKVQTSSFAPEFGRSPGAQIVMTSRGGTNDLHGSLFYYKRGDAFDANDWFANAGGYPKGRERQDRPGGTLGGALIKNQTFFFVSFEKLKLEAPESVIADVPDVATRKSATSALRPFLNAFPVPNGIDLGSNTAEYRTVLSNPSKENATSVRIDHVLDESTTLFARFSLTPSSSTRRGSEVSTPNIIIGQSSHNTLVTAGLSHAFADGTLNDLRVNFSRMSAGGASRMDNYGGAVPLLDSQVFPSGVTSATGSFALMVLGSAGYSLGGHLSNVQDQWNVVDSLTKVAGNHHLKTGVDLRRITQTNFRSPYSESVAFDGMIYSDWALLNGEAVNAQVSSSVGSVYPSYTNFSVYGQDTWRATDRTTVTYGLRWDVNPAPSTWKGPKPFALSTSNIAGVTENSPMYPTRWFDVAPRVGVAYLSDDTPGHEMVLRGGVGLFYDLGYGAVDGAFQGAPYANVLTISRASFPLTAANLAPPPLPPTRPYGEITTGDSALKSPKIYQWEATWEKSLGSGQMLSVGIVGTKGTSLMRTATEASYSAAYNLLRLVSNGAASNYDGLQFQYSKRFSGSLQTQLSYTWGHSIDSSSTDQGFGGGFASLFGNGERGPSDYDVRRTVNFSGSWRLPAPEAKPFYLLQNWFLDYVASARSGLPFDIQGVSGTTSGTAGAGLFAQVRPNFNGLPIWIRDNTVPGGRRLNKKAFTSPTGYAQGNLGRNALRGFQFSQLDLSLRRVIPFADRYRISVAAEGFNILNHANFANPSPLQGGNMSSPSFGIVTQMMNQAFGGGVNSLYRSGGSRSMELSIRLQF